MVFEKLSDLVTIELYMDPLISILTHEGVIYICADLG